LFKVKLKKLKIKNKIRLRRKANIIQELLGDRRPLTSWSENGMCALPDFAWTDWAKSQPDRVVDLMDINYLFFAQAGQDVSYKVIILKY
jgi:hypothetical protein